MVISAWQSGERCETKTKVDSSMYMQKVLHYLYTNKNIRTFEVPSKGLSLGNFQINLVFRSLIRTFVRAF